VPTPTNYLLNCLQATLPAILDCCEQLLVVVEGSAGDRAPIHAAFQTTRRTPTKHVPPRTFDSLSAAFAYAQPFAPHDVLELQRHLPPGAVTALAGLTGHNRHRLVAANDSGEFD
jgi:hypothetical protein